MPRSTPDFATLLRPVGECLIFCGTVDNKGYGKYRQGLAHRYAYECAAGPIPKGMTVDHKCFVPLCCKPDHLRLLTLSENCANQRSAFKTHCKHGHLLDEANTYIRTSKSGGRRDCRACIRDRVKKYQNLKNQRNSK